MRRCCDWAPPHSAKPRIANSCTVDSGQSQRPPSCLLPRSQSWPSRKSLPGRKPAISSSLPPSAEVHGIAADKKSVEIHLLRPTSETASGGEQQYSVAMDAQRRCSCGALLQLHLPLTRWGVQWRYQSLLILPHGEFHLISVRYHFHQVEVGHSAFLRRRCHLLDPCILALSSRSPSSIPPRLLHHHLKARLHPNRGLAELSTPRSLPSTSSVTSTLSPLSRGQMSTPLPHGIKGGRITYQSSVSSQVELRVSISNSHQTRGFEGAVLRREAVSYGYAGTHLQPCDDVISPLPQTPPSPMSSPPQWWPFSIPTLPSPPRPRIPPQTPSSPFTTNSAVHDVPSLYRPPFSSDMGSQSPLSTEFTDDNQFWPLLDSPLKSHYPPLMLSPVSSKSSGPYPGLASPSTGSSERLFLMSQGAYADSESESFDSALVRGAVQSVDETEEEEVAPTTPCPAARRLDMGSHPESQHSQSLPQSLSSFASSGAHSTSSAAASSFPLSTFSLPGVVAGVRGSSPVSNGLPAAGGSVAAIVGKQSQCPTAVVWLTLPQLRDVVMRVADASHSGGASVELRSVLLACHQDYPVVNGKSQVSYLVTWAGIAGDGGHARATFEAPFCRDSAAVNPFFTSYLQRAMEASGRLEPNPAQLHLVDVLFDMARINPSLAAILNYIPIMTHEELELYMKEDIELIAGRHPHYINYGRFGERSIGKGDTMQLHVALLKARVGSNSPDAPPPEPVVFFTTTESNRHSPASTEIAHPILLPPPFITNSLFTTAQREGCYPYEQRASVLSLASVTYHQLSAALTTDVHWHTATHNINSLDSDVMTVFSTSKESLSAPPSSTRGTYRYLSNELNDRSTLSSSSTQYSTSREQNIMSAAIDSFTRLSNDHIIIVRIWQTVTGYFHERTPHQPRAQLMKEESARMGEFIKHFLESVSELEGWAPRNINAWCRQAAPLDGRKTASTAYAVRRLCHGMQLNSVMAIAEELSCSHLEIMNLADTAAADRYLASDLECRKKQREVYHKKEKECMGTIRSAIRAAFSTSGATDGRQPEAVSTPMELLNLVIWQSEVKRFPPAQQCLQSLQDQLGEGVDRSTLLQWLSEVRTFSLDSITGELLEDPDNQWVTSTIKSLLPSISVGTGQRKCSHPPALLLSSIPAIDAPQGDYSRRVEYHLLQLDHQPRESPLHSRYASSLSSLVLSPMLPFINENAWADGVCRLYFLPVLIIRQPTLPLSLTSSLGEDWDSSSCSQAGPHLQLRCGDAVHISPRLCSQLGSYGQRPDCGTGQAATAVGREESSQLMTFFGALLMVGPQVSTEVDTAEVWALLSDSLCRWWVYRVDLSCPSPRMSPCPTGEAGQSGEAIGALHHLLGLSAGTASVHLINSDLRVWRDRCQQVWMAVLSWLHFAGDRVVPPPSPVMPRNGVSCATLLSTILDTAALPEQRNPHATSAVLVNQVAAEKLNAAVVQAKRTAPHDEKEEKKEEEEDGVEEKTCPDRRPKRSCTSRTPPPAAVSAKRNRGRKRTVTETDRVGKRGQRKEATKKTKDKAEKKATAAKKKRDLQRQEMEKQKEEEEVQRLRERTKEKQKRKRREKDRDSRLKKRLREQVSEPMKENTTHPTGATEGVRTRSGAAKDIPAINERPAAAVSAGSTTGRKRKNLADGKEKSLLEAVEVEDVIVEKKSANASNENIPLSSAEPSAASSWVNSKPPSPGTPPIPAGSADDVDSSSVESHDTLSPTNWEPNDRRDCQSPSLWHLYLFGVKGVESLSNFKGYDDEVKAWFRYGSNKTLHGRNFFHGAVVDVIDEWNFLRQWLLRNQKHPFSVGQVTLLERSKRPKPEQLAQSFVASVGFHNKEVRAGYLKAVKAHHLLTDIDARRKGKVKASHAPTQPPWEKYQGITLTTLHAERLDVFGNCIDNGTPSYLHPTAWPFIEHFRDHLAQTLESQQESLKRSDLLLPQSPLKKVKTGSESAVGWVDGGEGGAISSPISGTTDFQLSSSQPPLPVASGLEMGALREKVERLQAELKAEREKNSGVGSLSLGQSPHFTVSDAIHPSSVPSSRPLRDCSTKTSGRGAPSAASAVSPQPDEEKEIIDVATPSSAGALQLPPPVTTMLALPPNLHEIATWIGLGIRASQSSQCSDYHPAATPSPQLTPYPQNLHYSRPSMPPGPANHAYSQVPQSRQPLSYGYIPHFSHSPHPLPALVAPQRLQPAFAPGYYDQ